MKPNYYSSKRIFYLTATVLSFVIIIYLLPANLQRKCHCSSYILQDLDVDQMTLLQFKEYIHFQNLTSCEFQQDFGGSKQFLTTNKKLVCKLI